MSDSNDFLMLLSLVLIAFLIEQENAMHCNNRDDLLHFGNFNIFGGPYITQLNIYDEAFIAK